MLSDPNNHPIPLCTIVDLILSQVNGFIHGHLLLQTCPGRLCALGTGCRDHIPAIIQPHFQNWRHLPDVLYVNLYGPTEITCNCNYYIVDREFTEDQTLPIGVPFPNERVFLLDEEDHLVTEPGALGEICVSGTALALGYYRNSEKTSEAFVQNPLNHRYLEPIYRTGDLGRYENGELYYVTRKDFQIKHMGHRIELGEIETAFQALDGISRVCCIYDEPNTKIIGFYVGELEAKEISERLTERLPRFMIPNVFRQVDVMPLTKNGKIDRKCLMEEYRKSMQNRVKS